MFIPWHTARKSHLLRSSVRYPGAAYFLEYDGMHVCFRRLGAALRNLWPCCEHPHEVYLSTAVNRLTL